MMCAVHSLERRVGLFFNEHLAAVLDTLYLQVLCRYVGVELLACRAVLEFQPYLVGLKLGQLTDIVVIAYQEVLGRGFAGARVYFHLLGGVKPRPVIYECKHCQVY